MNQNNPKMELRNFKHFETFPVWNLKPVEIERPSKYFRLVPVGTGTSEAESLCSYIVRLAEEHCVSPTRIVFHSAGNEIHSLPFILQECSISKDTGRTVNGLGKTAETISNFIGKATSIEDIKYHTFLPWQNLISHHKLLDKVRSWCPDCY